MSELRNQLRQRGLNHKGTKRTLLRRLQTASADTNGDSDSTRPGSPNSRRESDKSGSATTDHEETHSLQPGDSISCASGSVHSAQSGSCISQSLLIKQANAAAKRAGLEARMMLLSEKQRLTEETRAARQREIELELKRERLELEMEILDSTAREREFGKFKTRFENQIGANISNVRPDVQMETQTTATWEKKSFTVDINNENKDDTGIDLPRGHHTNEDKNQIVTKTEMPAFGQVDDYGAATVPAHEMTAAQSDTLTQMLRLTSLPRVEIEKFDGDVSSYRSFIRAFEHLIGNKVTDEDEKLYYLEQYTTGQPREIVKGCLHMPAKRGYKEARRLIETRYGNEHRMAARSVDRILNWLTVKVDDIDAMDDFSIALRTCYNSMADMVSGVSELDHPKTMRKILEKLPLSIQDRWRRLADVVNEQKNRVVAFKDLVEFVEREARIVTNPLFGRHLFTVRGQPDIRQRREPARRYTLAASVDQADHGSQSVLCLWCKAPLG